MQHTYTRFTMLNKNMYTNLREVCVAFYFIYLRTIKNNYRYKMCPNKMYMKIVC